MLKQAIAEAKTIKETAIANAKLQLEEAFTPQLTAMFAEKLNELEEEEEKVDESVTEVSDEKEEMEETFNIDEILAELEMTEETDEVEETLDEELMLEEMSDEEIEELVTQVIDDMIASGKLMAGEESEEEESEEEVEMDDMTMDSEEEGSEEEESEEVSIDEILAELEESEKEKVEEVDLGTLGNMLDQAIATGDAGRIALAVASAVSGGAALSAIKGYIQDKLAGKKIKEADEMEETINELKNELNEVNLLNAKLLYTNKIFKAKNLTESEKVKVLNAFDKAANVKEVKLVFETLTESLKTKNTKTSPIRESLGGASKTITTATPNQPIIEVNEAFARMQKLAGIKK